jgi:hypothetical protein
VTKTVIKFNKRPNRRSNITMEECRALQHLKHNDSIQILPADKGRCTVIMDKDDYQDKISALLSDHHTYSKLSSDPTNQYKNRLLKLLKDWKSQNIIDQSLYFKLYPGTAIAPRFYGLPKIHKTNIPLRPIVASIGCITSHLKPRNISHQS